MYIYNFVWQLIEQKCPNGSEKNYMCCIHISVNNELKIFFINTYTFSAIKLSQIYRNTLFHTNSLHRIFDDHHCYIMSLL